MGVIIEVLIILILLSIFLRVNLTKIERKKYVRRK